jgi:hypothetical protein
MKAILKPIRLALLKLAIRTIERAGLAVVQVRQADDAVYLVSRRGEYVRFNKVKNGR